MLRYVMEGGWNFLIFLLLSPNEGACGVALFLVLLTKLSLTKFFRLSDSHFLLLLKIRRNLFCLIYFGFFIIIFYFGLSMIFIWVFGLCGVSVFSCVTF